MGSSSWIMEYDLNRIEIVKTQKTKYVIKTSEHFFQFSVDWIVHDNIFSKTIFLCSNMLCEMFYLLRCFAFTGLKCFSASLKLMYLLPNTMWYSGFLWMKTQLNMKLQMNCLWKDNCKYLLKCWLAINSPNKVLYVRW